MSVYQTIAESMHLQKWQVENVVQLQQEDNTVPFIARYRKEKTGDLDEVAITSILDNHQREQEFGKRRDYILKYLQENGHLTPDLHQKIKGARTMAELEDLYQPFKPRRKTLADKAVELGLGPLAEAILGESLSQEQALQKAASFIGESVPSASVALEKAKDILVQRVSDTPEVRSYLRPYVIDGRVSAKVKRGKKDSGVKYQDFFDFEGPLAKQPSHRIMALVRGEKEGILNLAVSPGEELSDHVTKIGKLAFGSKGERGEVLNQTCASAFERNLVPSLGKEAVQQRWRSSEEDSLRVFGQNLQGMLLAAPFGEKAVLAVDPGIRTGCKVVALDARGNFLDYQTLFLNRGEQEAAKVIPWVQRYAIEGIAVGNGTYGRESLAILQKLQQTFPELKDVVIASVDEDGASVYSASEVAREEFPNLDLTVRGAISIGRRFQDPMAELVKIDPKSLGIGQYQHDITPSLLQKYLEQTVEIVVNRVGVNINTASYHLLALVSGLDKKKAKEIVAHRTKIGGFRNRKQIKEVKGIGDKAFEQASGFLRIHAGDNPLDATGVHPEMYDQVMQICDFYGLGLKELLAHPEKININEILQSLTLANGKTVVQELGQKGLDPRQEFQATQFNEHIASMEDLVPEMVLNGVVANLVAFGAFVDIGIKENGLVHISEMADTFVRDPADLLAVGQKVQVRVLAIDKERGRISLSLKGF